MRAEAADITVEICWGHASAQHRVTFKLPAGSTLDEALFSASLSESLDDRPPADFVAAGILGQRCAPGTRLRDGDRIELYRPLLADPKDARRARVAAQRPPRR